jgi:D-xylulose reductase
MTSSTSISQMQNPSIVLYGAKNAQLEDKPITSPLDPHHVLVRIAYVGVCGSDVHFPSHSPISYLPLTSPRSTSGTTAASENSSTPPPVS